MVSADPAGKPVVVLGSGLAGWTTVREFRKLDTVTPVVMVTADDGHFYAKPTLSNAVAQNRQPAQLVTTPAEAMAANLNVSLLTQTRAEAIRPHQQEIVLPTGPLAYRHLVLATGARPIRVPIAGNAAHRVLSVNSLDDFAVFHPELQRGRTVLVMGAGLIGCEFANDLIAGGIQVTLVDPAPHPLAALLPAEAGAALQAALEAAGVRFCLGTTVQALDGTPDGRTLATLANGETLVADAVLSAIGLRADLSLAQAAGIACDRGVLVGDQLQTSAPNIHALGDCAQYASAGHLTLPYVMPIMHAAKALAATLAGQPAQLAFPVMPVAVKTPALPLVLLPPPANTVGGWTRESGERWDWLDEAGRLRGFVLAGAATRQRMAMSAAVHR